MLLRLTFLILITLTLTNCTDPRPPVLKPNYAAFELSYCDGWHENFSFFADSNKIYLATNGEDMVCYGFLPSEILEMLNTTVSKIAIEKSIESRELDCSDCSTVALRLVAEGDTIRIKQDLTFHPVIDSLVRQMKVFMEDSSQQWIPAQLNLETRSAIFPPAPPLTKEIRLRI
jgi:hypothetical protein